MGLPDNWTKYGENDELIPPMHRYRALGNAIYWDKAIMLMMGIKMA